MKSARRPNIVLQLVCMFASFCCQFEGSKELMFDNCMKLLNEHSYHWKKKGMWKKQTTNRKTESVCYRYFPSFNWKVSLLDILLYTKFMWCESVNALANKSTREFLCNWNLNFQSHQNVSKMEFYHQNKILPVSKLTLQNGSLFILLCSSWNSTVISYLNCICL